VITGIPVSNQTVSLLESESDPRIVATLDDDSKKLGFYGLRDWQVIMVRAVSGCEHHPRAHAL
jgi:Ubiquitin-like domain